MLGGSLTSAHSRAPLFSSHRKTRIQRSTPMLSTGDPAGVRQESVACRCYRQVTPLGSGCESVGCCCYRQVTPLGSGCESVGCRCYRQVSATRTGAAQPPEEGGVASRRKGPAFPHGGRQSRKEGSVKILSHLHRERLMLAGEFIPGMIPIAGHSATFSNLTTSLPSSPLTSLYLSQYHANVQNRLR